MLTRLVSRDGRDVGIRAGNRHTPESRADKSGGNISPVGRNYGRGNLPSENEQTETGIRR